MEEEDGQVLVLRLGEPQVLSTAVDVMRDLTTAATFVVDTTGLRVTTTDSAHVLLFSLHLFRNSAFKSWPLSDGDGSVSFAVDLGMLNKLLKGVKKDDDVQLALPVADDRPIELTIRKGGMSGSIHHHKLSQIMIVDQDEISIDGFDEQYTTEALVRSEYLTEVVAQLKPLGHRVRVCIAPSKLSFTTSNELTQSSITVPNSEVTLMCNAPLDQEFSFDYIQIISKASKISDFVLLQCGENCPFSIVFKIRELGKYQFFLAPIVDNDADEGNFDDDDFRRDSR